MAALSIPAIVTKIYCLSRCQKFSTELLSHLILSPKYMFILPLPSIPPFLPKFHHHLLPTLNQLISPTMDTIKQDLSSSLPPPTLLLLLLPRPPPPPPPTYLSSPTTSPGHRSSGPQAGISLSNHWSTLPWNGPPRWSISWTSMAQTWGRITLASADVCKSNTLLHTSR